MVADITVSQAVNAATTILLVVVLVLLTLPASALQSWCPAPACCWF